MGIFDKFKKDKVIDYTDRYEYSIRKKSAPRIQSPSGPSLPSPIQLPPPESNSASQSSPASNLGFLSDFSQATQNSQTLNTPAMQTYDNTSSLNPEEKKEKLKQRLLNMTTQLEDISNQLYRLQQRMELIEQKLKTRSDYLG